MRNLSSAYCRASSVLGTPGLYDTTVGVCFTTSPRVPHGRACAEPSLPGPEETRGDGCTLSRSSLHRRTGDLGMSAPSAPVMGLLTSRMTCGRTHSCEQAGRDAVEAKGRMGSVWSGPLIREAGPTGQKRQANVVSCHMCGHIRV